MDISKLIYIAYSKYGEITNQDIAKLRLKHRLKVVQVSWDCVSVTYLASYMGPEHHRYITGTVKLNISF